MNFFNLIRRSHFSKFAVILLLLIDLLVISVAYGCNVFLHLAEQNQVGQEFITLYVIILLSWIVSSFYVGVYHTDNLYRLKRVIIFSLCSLLGCALIVSAYVFFIKPGLFSLPFLITQFILIFGGIFLVRIIEIKLTKIPESLLHEKRNTIIIGVTDTGKKLHNYFQNEAPAHYNFLGFLDDHPSGQKVAGSLEEIKRYCLRKDVDEIFYTLPNHSALINELADFAGEHYVHFNLVQNADGLSGNNIGTQIYDNGKFPIVIPRRDPLRLFFNQQVKRAFDIVFSSLVIVLIFPFIVPLVALAIKTNSKGPVFFRQLRSGINGRPFWCYKFRTMTVNGESDSKQATKNDPRITKVGAFLRKTSLDEFPQFYNVLIGDMSVVGPRPHMLKHTKEYAAIIDEFKIRHFINSGITGYAQVNGYRGETRNNHMMQKRVEFDNWYLQNWSLLLDLKIIFLTVFNAIKGEKNAF